MPGRRRPCDDDLQRLVRSDYSGYSDSPTEVPPTTVTYGYNGEGQRIWQKDQDRVTRYRYDGSQIIADVDGTGGLLAQFFYLPGGEIFANERAHTPNFYLRDGLGSVESILDPSAQPAANYSYDDFGAILSQSEGVYNHFKFTGALYDPTPNLYQMGARYYDPNQGRFLTPDSWPGDPWTPWTQNLYTYVGNNPIRYTDPTGHYPAAFGAYGGTNSLFMKVALATALLLTVITHIHPFPTILTTPPGTPSDSATIMPRGELDGPITLTTPQTTPGPTTLITPAETQLGPTLVNAQRLSSDWRHIAKHLGINLRNAGDAVEEAKGRVGRGGADNVMFDPKTGDIIAPETGEVIGNLADFE